MRWVLFKYVLGANFSWNYSGILICHSIKVKKNKTRDSFIKRDKILNHEGNYTQSKFSALFGLEKHIAFRSQSKSVMYANVSVKWSAATQLPLRSYLDEI